MNKGRFMKKIIAIIMFCVIFSSLSFAGQKPTFQKNDIIDFSNYNNYLSTQSSFCSLLKHTLIGVGTFNGIAPKDKFVTYFDPSVCPDFECLFEITSLRFGFVNITGSSWPLSIDVVVYDLADSTDKCIGPGTEKYRFNIQCDQNSFAIPSLGTAIFPVPCTLSTDFFIGIEYSGTDSNQTIYPSLLVDSTSAPDSCDNFFYFDIPTNQQWNEWYDFWVDTPGYPFFKVDGNTITPCYTDSDSDGIPDSLDNCPLVANISQDDGDLDGVGDVCDNCPTVYNDNQNDADYDGIGNVCDACPNDAHNDIDNDGYCADVDNCPTLYNPGQDDLNNNNIGDLCENCCQNSTRGDINYDGTPTPDISDLLYMVDFMFQSPSGPEPPCKQEADLNSDTTIDITDLLLIVDYMFASPPGPAPDGC